jgi:hypothetical protein
MQTIDEWKANLQAIQDHVKYMGFAEGEPTPFDGVLNFIRDKIDQETAKTVDPAQTAQTAQTAETA